VVVVLELRSELLGISSLKMTGIACIVRRAPWCTLCQGNPQRTRRVAGDPLSAIALSEEQDDGLMSNICRTINRSLGMCFVQVLYICRTLCRRSPDDWTYEGIEEDCHNPSDGLTEQSPRAEVRTGVENEC
jgi:hypothetical protein